MDTPSLTNDLRIAIVGCGSMGQRHISNLIDLGNLRLIAADPQEEQRRAVSQKFNVRTVADLDDLWNFSPEVVFVTTPSNLHVTQALRSVKHGCHIFVEKPLSYSLDGVVDLITAIRDKNVITMIGCNMRFHPGPATVKRLLDENWIGTVIAARIQTGSYLPRWRSAQDYRGSYSASSQWGGAILDCIHEIDLALWYLGLARVVAAAHIPAKTIDLSTDGLAEIILEHESGCLSSVHLNFIQRDYRRTCQIIGSEGTIYWDFMDHTVRLFGPDGELAQTFTEPPGWELNQMYVDEIKHFLTSVRTNVQTINPIENGLLTLKIALEVREKNGRLS